MGRTMKKLLCVLLAAVMMMSLAGCKQREDKPPVKEVSLSEIHDEIKSAYGEDYIPSMEYDESMLESLFGLKKDMYDEIVAEGPMISAHVDQFIAVKAAEGKADDVEKALNDYRDRQINDSMQYPMNQVKVKASEVVRHGDYVFFVMLGSYSMENDEEGEEAILEAAKTENKIGVDIINSYFE
ncbi:DUF4358 domain-containing protein [Anaerolentibacter hominis]|uniref:DUF4358 domain-containing protein n=1 Tax=Anaerolentibacter hominis TaxID=3079009 RepID=UPI0031B806B5